MISMCQSPLGFRCRFDGGANAWIRTATADIARHEAVDICIGGVLVRREQRSGRHDLAGLTVTTLRNIECDPGLLYCIVVQAFDRGHFLSCNRADLRLAGAYRH